MNEEMISQVRAWGVLRPDSPLGVAWEDGLVPLVHGEAERVFDPLGMRWCEVYEVDVAAVGEAQWTLLAALATYLQGGEVQQGAGESAQELRALGELRLEARHFSGTVFKPAEVAP